MLAILKKMRNLKKKKTPPICQWDLQRIQDADMAWYERGHGYRFDLQHPVTFTEKLQWYKLFYKNDLFPHIVDKYEFKSYVRERLGEGYTIPLLGVWSDLQSLEKSWDSLPEHFCLKSTISGGGANIKIIKSKSSTDFKALRQELAKWLDPKNTMLNGYCTAYYSCTPRILAEEYMSQVDGQLYDYKVFCFDGKPHCFYVATDHFPGQLSHISFYDLDWNRLDVRYGEHPNCDVERPKHFDEMLRLARKLSAGFPFVRVDFFDVEERCLLAEMTFYPGGGGTPYHPERFNRELGDLFHLPIQDAG